MCLHSKDAVKRKVYSTNITACALSKKRSVQGKSSKGNPRSGANNHKEIKGIAKQRHPGGTSSVNKEELEAERLIKILQFRDGGQNLDGESPA